MRSLLGELGSRVQSHKEIGPLSTMWEPGGGAVCKICRGGLRLEGSPICVSLPAVALVRGLQGSILVVRTTRSGVECQRVSGLQLTGKWCEIYLDWDYTEFINKYEVNEHLC